MEADGMWPVGVALKCSCYPQPEVKVMSISRITRVAICNVAVVVAALLGTVAPAAAVDIADLRAQARALLNPDATVTVTVRVRCDAQWQPAELDARVTQGDSYADGFTIPTVACNGHWQRLRFDVATAWGTLQAGRVIISSQFLVTNVDTGDSAEAHDQRKGSLVLAS